MSDTRTELEQIKLKLMELEEIKSESESDLLNISVDNPLEACRGCLATGLDLYSLYENGLGQLFDDFTGIPVVPTDGYPQLVCSMCRALLRKFFTFRMRCHSALYTLQQMQANNVEITTDSLSSYKGASLRHNLNRTDIQLISYNGTIPKLEYDITTENTDLINEEKDSDTKTIHKIEPECLEDINFSDDGIMSIDKITPLNFGNSIGGNFNDLEVKEEQPVIRTRVSINTAVKKKRIKTENTKKPANKKTKKATVKNKGTETEVYLKLMVRAFKKIMHENKNANFVDIWDMVCQQSLSVNDREDSIEEKGQSIDKCGDVVKFVQLTRKFYKLYNFDVNFLSAEDHRKEIEDRRSSDKYARAKYKCEICCKVYVIEDTYKRHMVYHDPASGDVECEICRYRFMNRKSFSCHFRKLHTSKVICKECGLTVRSSDHAKHHFNWHRGSTTACEHCGKHCRKGKSYLQHLRRVHRNKATALCLLCGKTYNGDKGLRVHMDAYHKQAISCDGCGGLFRTVESLTAHIDNVCRPGESSCPVCGENFPSKELMRQHYDDLHKFTCAQCNLVLPTLEKREKHMERCGYPRNSGRLNLMCDQCGKGNFQCRTLLAEHMRKHTGEKPHKCDFCPKTFRTLQTLKSHRFTHTGEKLYKCSQPQCDRRFRQHSHMKRHLLTHTLERPHACAVCGKTFALKDNLTAHTKTVHEGHPPRKRNNNRKI